MEQEDGATLTPDGIGWNDQLVNNGRSGMNATSNTKNNNLVKKYKFKCNRILAIEFKISNNKTLITFPSPFSHKSDAV